MLKVKMLLVLNDIGSIPIVRKCVYGPVSLKELRAFVNVVLTTPLIEAVKSWPHLLYSKSSAAIPKVKVATVSFSGIRLE